MLLQGIFHRKLDLFLNFFPLIFNNSNHLVSTDQIGKYLCKGMLFVSFVQVIFLNLKYDTGRN